MSARLSGVQREVNQLYRLLLRAARVKDGGEWAGSTTELVRAEFRAQVCEVTQDTTPPEAVFKSRFIHNRVAGSAKTAAWKPSRRELSDIVSFHLCILFAVVIEL